jgi:hypothetical protein
MVMYKNKKNKKGGEVNLKENKESRKDLITIEVE